MKGFLPSLLLLLSQLGFGQSVDGKEIHGKIVAASGNVAGVTIVNLVNEKSTVSEIVKANFIFWQNPKIYWFFLLRI